MDRQESKQEPVTEWEVEDQAFRTMDPTVEALHQMWMSKSPEEREAIRKKWEHVPRAWPARPQPTLAHQISLLKKLSFRQMLRQSERMARGEFRPEDLEGLRPEDP